MKLVIINSFIAAILSFGAFLLFAGDGAMNIIKQFMGKTSSAPIIVSAVNQAPVSATTTTGKIGAAASTSVAAAASTASLRIDYSVEKTQIFDSIKALAPQLKAKKEEYLKLQNLNKDKNKVAHVSSEWLCLDCKKTNPGVGSSRPAKCFYCSSSALVPAAQETQDDRDAKALAVKSAHDELKGLEKQMAELQAQFSEISKKEQEAKLNIKKMQQAEAQTKN